MDDQDHYEVLEVRRDASEDEIERSYLIAAATYEGDSLALYSLYDGADAEAIRERIDWAYRVLSDEESRRSYDAEMAATMTAASPAVAPPKQVAAVQPELPAIDRFEDLEAEEGDDFDGPRLRRARLRRGVELEEVARITKISAANLRFIEENGFEDLPATVYVRGFVTAYARVLGLEPTAVAESYIAHFEAASNGQRRGRLLGRK